MYITVSGTNLGVACSKRVGVTWKNHSFKCSIIHQLFRVDRETKGLKLFCPATFFFPVNSTFFFLGTSLPRMTALPSPIRKGKNEYKGDSIQWETNRTLYQDLNPFLLLMSSNIHVQREVYDVLDRDQQLVSHTLNHRRHMLTWSKWFIWQTPQG